MKRGSRGLGRVYLRGNVWWIQWNRDGVKQRESAGRDRDGNPLPKKAAVELLQQRQQEARAGRPHEDAVKVTVADLKALHDADYKLQERRSGRRQAQLWKHLTGYFGANEPAIRITALRLDAYVMARLDAGAARNTIKNECNALRRAFKLAQRGGTLLANEVPIFPTIKTSDPRAGFFEHEEHDRVRAALPPDEGDVAEFLFLTGWRTSEAKGLRWSDVDATAGIIRIETTKSGKPRTLPYSVLPPLAQLIAHRREVTDAVQRKRSMKVNYVFHRNGERIRHFRRSWTTACIAAGLGQEIREPDVLDAAGAVVKRGRLVRKVAHRIPHDYRRSAARNLSRAGVAEGVIMKLCGWLTRSVFDRYNIVAERDLAEGLAKLAKATTPAGRSKVTRIRARKS